MIGMRGYGMMSDIFMYGMVLILIMMILYGLMDEENWK